MEQSFVTRRFVAAVLILAAMNFVASPPSGTSPAVAGAVLGTVTGAAVIVAITKALYLGARRFAFSVTADD